LKALEKWGEGSKEARENNGRGLIDQSRVYPQWA
jgi:hypothetical protein